MQRRPSTQDITWLLDLRRLATNITALREGVQINIERLEKILDEGKAQRAGAHPSNLSPYGTVVQYLFDVEKEKMITLLKNTETRTKILISAEIELPVEVAPTEFRNAVFVSRVAV